ncbi:hypothetical protein [Rhizobium sp. AAP43]|uniref:hypothetical protein n=1 Tax=Rhizobium sp. AAP43 TaxID=1523420 RepID=UPI0006B99E14|nr:hypothetical protein [Rhizobium sp. AAP43]KPF41962.1 hypothetical protein IP76_19330 [Rhizobium sp. AAP43]
MKAVRGGMLLIVMLTVLPACQREDAVEPLKLSGKVFIFNYRIAQATYVLTLARNGPLPDPSYVEARYENPAGGAALITRSQIFPFWDKISLESPPVHCVVKGRPYAVSIRVTDGQNVTLQEIETTLTSTLDQSLLPGKPLVIGPVYTPNPEVYNSEGEADYAQEDCRTGAPANK